MRRHALVLAQSALILLAASFGCVGGNDWGSPGDPGSPAGPGEPGDPADPADPGDPSDPTVEPSLPPPEPEVCNGYDEDLDGEVDEGCPCTLGHTQACFPGPEGRAGVGECRMGVQTCEGEEEFAGWGPCVGAVGPEAETCGDGIDSDCDGADLPCETEEQVDTFIYGEEGRDRPVDIVWAVDQSGSMGDEIDLVQRNINRFSETIAASGIDYHVTMVAARTRDPDDHEVCVPPPLAEPGCADSDRFRQVDQHVDSHDALLQIQLHIGAIEAFMRPGSLRVFVVVTDDESDLPAAAFDAWLRSRGGYDDYVFDCFVGIDEDVCDDIAEEGDRYVNLSAWTGGAAEHICTPDWGMALERFARDIIERNLVFGLSRTPVVESIRVFYVPAPGLEEEQPRDVAWRYDATLNAVVLDEGHLPADGTAVQIRYAVAP